MDAKETAIFDTPAMPQGRAGTHMLACDCCGAVFEKPKFVCNEGTCPACGHHEFYLVTACADCGEYVPYMDYETDLCNRCQDDMKCCFAGMVAAMADILPFLMRDFLRRELAGTFLQEAFAAGRGIEEERQERCDYGH